MKRRVGLLTGLFLVLGLALCIHTWAAEPPPTTGTIVGPELWGVIVYDCSKEKVATLRVKRTCNGNVETQAVVEEHDQCLSEAPLYHKLEGVTLFKINPDPAVMVPIFTKIENYKEEPNGKEEPKKRHIYSFDVQIKFWLPQGEKVK